MPEMKRPPRYQHWTERLLDLGTLYALFWIPGMLVLCWLLPLLPSSLWKLAIPFLLPVLPALTMTFLLWLLVRRRGYDTLWAALGALLHQSVRALVGPPQPPALPPDRLALGTTGDGEPLCLDSPALNLHILVDGKTRQGKSTLLATIACQDVARSDCAVVVLDPHAALVDQLLVAGLTDVADERLVALLPDQDHVPAFNLLQPLPGETAESCATRLVESALALWFSGQLIEAQRFQNYAFHAAWILAETGWTVLEIEPLLRHRPFRHFIAGKIADPRLRAWLIEIERERDDRLRELTESTVNRFRAFGRGTAGLIFGQRQTTFDLPALLDGGGVLLAALPTAALGETGAYLAAGVLLSLIDGCLARRPKDSPTHSNPRLRLLADEAQAYAVPPLRRLLAERAGFGASLVLSTQGLGQLDDPQLARFVLNNVSVQVAFACSAEEARRMTEEIFRPDPLLVKSRREPWVTFYSPHEQMAYWTKEIQNLPAYDFYVRAPGQEPTRGTTEPLPVKLDGAALASVRANLARRIGRPRDAVEAGLAERRRWIYEGKPSKQQPQPEKKNDGWV